MAEQRKTEQEKLAELTQKSNNCRRENLLWKRKLRLMSENDVPKD